MQKQLQIPLTEALTIPTYQWLPENDTPKAIVQIIHGMMEHAERYGELAEYLCRQGYCVYAHDLPGHGKSVTDPTDLGHMPKRGWMTLLKSIEKVHEEIKKEHKNIPVILFGHSMGSVLARHHILRNPDNYDGLILSGLNHTPAMMGRLGAILSSISMRFQGRKHRNRLLSYLVYGKFKRPFKEGRITVFDWLSRDKEKVNEYVESSLCGNPNTSGFYLELFKGFNKLGKLKESVLPDSIPVYIFAGTMDPVGKFGLDPMLLQKRFKASGIQNTELKLYRDGRHEMINETNREEVYQDIARWLEENW